MFSNIDHRTALIRKNILLSFLIKGWSGAIFLLLVPLTLHCLGAYENGVWLTISGILIWIDNMDIGLGNGLRNKLAFYLANNNIDKAREVVSSTYFMLMLIIIPTTALLILIINNINAYSVIDPQHVVKDLNKIISIALILVCSTFIFKFIGNFYQGMQLPAMSILLTTIGHTLILIGTYYLYKTDSHSLMDIVLINTISPLLVYLIAYPYTFLIRYKALRPTFTAFSWESVRDLFFIGVRFFILQICGAIIMQSMNFIISKYFMPSMVTPYQIAYRYFSIMMLAFSIIATPYWSATTDAYAKGDMQWIRTAMKRTNKILFASIIGVIIMTIASPIFYKIWIGDMATVPWVITIMMGVYTVTYITIMSYSFFLNGIGALNIQLITSVTSVFLFIILSIILAQKTHNITSILILMSAINIPCVIFDIIQFNKIIYGTAKGIWKR